MPATFTPSSIASGPIPRADAQLPQVAASPRRVTEASIRSTL